VNYSDRRILQFPPTILFSAHCKHSKRYPHLLLELNEIKLLQVNRRETTAVFRSRSLNVRFHFVRLRFWTISCRQRMLTKGINPRPNIPFQHPAGVRFCVAGARTAADHIQLHCNISSSSLWELNSSWRSIRITAAVWIRL